MQGQPLSAPPSHAAVWRQWAIRRYRLVVRAIISAALLVFVLHPVAPRAQGQRQVPGAFRSRVVLVPLDVRVLDRQGQPVTDLTARDFVILEDGRPQEIRLFSTQAYAEAESAGTTYAVLGSQADAEAAAASARTFLVVLGRGRLQGPARGLAAVSDFVRNGLSGDDRVGIVAYNRLTELTTDRESVLRLLERYRARHESIEAVLDQWFTGLQFLYGSRDHPPGVHAEIDELFETSGIPTVRHLATVGVAEDSRLDQERQRLLDAVDPANEASMRGFVYDTAARDDLERPYTAVERLRYVDGEKHLIFLSEDGLLGLPPAHTDRLATIAADARVTMSTIQTSGLQTSWRGGAFSGPSWRYIWASRDARELAEHTGGFASSYQYASRTLERIERATRFHYLLGYYPSNQDWDGRYRRLEVRVARDGARVLHRRGYYGRDRLVPYDRRAFVTHSRIAAGAAYRQEIADLAVRVSASFAEAESGRSVEVKLAIDASGIAFTEADGRHEASIELAVYVGSRTRRVIGELRKTMELKLLPETYAHLQATGQRVTHSARIDVSDAPKYVKAVVYDYASDRLGTAAVEIEGAHLAASLATLPTRVP